MKKILFFILFISNMSFSVNWHSTADIDKIIPKLKFGDVIVYKPIDTLVSQFGHVKMVSYDDKVIDFPFIGYGIKEEPMHNLVSANREFTVVRYKNINDTIREKMNKLIDEKYLYMSYSIFAFPELNLNTSYCSHFIYHLYKDVVKGSVLDDPGNIIMPLDFLNKSAYFYELEF